jgi:hypothetical protein
VADIPEEFHRAFWTVVRQSPDPDGLAEFFLRLARGLEGEVATPEGIGLAARDLLLTGAKLTPQTIRGFVATADDRLAADRVARARRAISEDYDQPEWPRHATIAAHREVMVPQPPTHPPAGAQGLPAAIWPHAMQDHEPPPARRRPSGRLDVC